MKTILWDFNGTIINDVKLCLDIENEMLKNRQMDKYPVSLEEYLLHFTFPVIEYYRYMGYTFEKESFIEISQEFIRRYDEGFSTCSLCPNVEEVLKRAKEKGYKQYIVSASQQEKLDEQVRSLGIQSYFDGWVGISNILAGSKLEMAKEFMEQQQFQKEDCIFIGDTVHDFEVAQALGIPCYLIANGHQAKAVLEKTSAIVFNDAGELPL